jgi:flagellar FliJ protein
VFKFRLERILDHKEVLEKSAEQLLAQAIKEHRRCLEAFQERCNRLQELNSEIQIQDLSYVLHIDLFKEALREQIKRLEKQVEMAEQEVAACQDNLVLARKERLLLEKLKERKLTEYHVELDRKEAILNDELASMRFNRRTRS